MLKVLVQYTEHKKVCVIYTKAINIAWNKRQFICIEKGRNMQKYEH